MVSEIYKDPEYAQNYEKSEDEKRQPRIICFCCIKPAKIPIYYDILICFLLIVFFFTTKEGDKGDPLSVKKAREKKHLIAKVYFLLFLLFRLAVEIILEKLRRVFCNQNYRKFHS